MAEAYRTEMLGKPRSPRTLEEYWRLPDGYVIPAIGRLRVREFTTARADRFLNLTLDAKGASNTKTVRTLLSGMFKVAARHDAVAANPIRETASVSIPRKQAIALTLDQARDLRAKLRADERAVSRDLTDLTDLMLATGSRIGEALAVTWNCLRLWTVPCDCHSTDTDSTESEEACLDPDRHWRGAVEIRGTVIRIKGKGPVIKPSPKSQAGFRTLGIPSWCAAILGARQDQNPTALPSDPVFPRVRAERDPDDPADVAPLVRDPSNTTKHLRAAYDAAGYPEVTSHIQGRKTVATAMDDAGLSARQAADQLGHADIGTTQKHYFGRQTIVTDGAAVMEQIVDASTT